jgi:hypothetical protein
MRIITGEPVNNLDQLPKKEHWQIVITETYTPYDGYNNDGTGIKTVIHVYTDREMWLSDIQALTKACMKFYAAHVKPATIKTVVTVDG